MPRDNECSYCIETHNPNNICATEIRSRLNALEESIAAINSNNKSSHNSNTEASLPAEKEVRCQCGGMIVTMMDGTSLCCQCDLQYTREITVETIQRDLEKTIKHSAKDGTNCIKLREPTEGVTFTAWTDEHVKQLDDTISKRDHFIRQLKETIKELKAENTTRANEYAKVYRDRNNREGFINHYNLKELYQEFLTRNKFRGVR